MKDSSRGSRRERKKEERESRKSLVMGLDKMEKRKSGLFARKSNVQIETVAAKNPHAFIGLDVCELAERDGQPVPLIVEKCISFINEVGFTEPGIFRVSGDKNRMDQLCKAFESGDKNPLGELLLS